MRGLTPDSPNLALNSTSILELSTSKVQVNHLTPTVPTINISESFLTNQSLGLSIINTSTCVRAAYLRGELMFYVK